MGLNFRPVINVVKRIALVLLMFIGHQTDCSGQEQIWPDGIYFEYEQFIRRSPELVHDIELIENDLRKLADNGASQYRFKSKSDGFSSYRLNLRPVIIVHQGEVYLNTLKLELGEGFSKCLTKGHFLVFPVNTSNTDAISPGGAALLLLAGVGPGRRVTLQFTLFVLSLRTGNPRRLKQEYVRERLSENQKLLDEFLNETIVNDSILVNYVDRFNRSLEVSITGE